MSPASPTESAAGPAPAGAPVVVVGAGLAGLAAAAALARAGRAVQVLEAGDGVGGRVRSDRTPEGFILDRGFQVLFTEYPAARELLDFPALRLCAFDAGALVAGDPPMEAAGDPLASPRLLPRLLARSPLTLGDDLRLLGLKLALMGPDPPLLGEASERSGAEELAARGFSERAMAQFLRPFFGGILLDRGLSARAPWLLYLFKMLSEGRTVLPAGGMGAIAQQLAGRLPPGALQLNTAVTVLERDAAGRVSGLRAGERRLPAAAVVLAADIWSARRLWPDLPDLAPAGCTTIYYAGEEALYSGRLLVVNPDPAGFLNECAQLTNAAPGYAPPGRHLLSCTALTAEPADDEAVDRRARAELRRWFGPRVDALRRLAVYRLPRAQFRQPPGWRQRRPPLNPAPGLYLAGEYMDSSSIQGALLSGLRAARAVLAEAA